MFGGCSYIRGCGRQWATYFARCVMGQNRLKAYNSSVSFLAQGEPTTLVLRDMGITTRHFLDR